MAGKIYIGISSEGKARLFWNQTKPPVFVDGEWASEHYNGTPVSEADIPEYDNKDLFTQNDLFGTLLVLDKDLEFMACDNG